VHFDGPAVPGRFLPIRITASTALSLRGVRVEPALDQARNAHI
jgi:hypothetical protein